MRGILKDRGTAILFSYQADALEGNSVSKAYLGAVGIATVIGLCAGIFHLLQVKQQHPGENIDSRSAVRLVLILNSLLLTAFLYVCWGMIPVAFSGILKTVAHSRQ